MYARASTLSDGHPYPLLNALKMEALETGKMNVAAVRGQLEKARDLRLAQTLTTPPTDAPWCYFDLAEIHLYQNDRDGFLGYLEKGIAACDANWQTETFRESLKNTLVDQGIAFDGLSEGMALLG